MADEIRDQILAGAYLPGERLPTIKELEARYGVSAAVVRHAVEVLQAEGLLMTRRGGGTVVRPPPPARRLAMDRYKAALEIAAVPDTTARATAFTTDQHISWAEYRLDKDYSQAEADDELAALFGLPAGVPLLRRHFVFYANDVPSQISINYMPWDLVHGTRVADPCNEPWPGGTLAQCASLEHPVTRVEEHVRTRMPTHQESETLQIARGVPIFAITRRMLSGTKVMEVCRDIILPGDSVVLEYSIDL
jgi:GntR family transcriptional regulator